MAHIFRLHKEGSNTLVDWDISAKYGTTVIEQIEDPNGDSSSREITSIPSPFARIDLVKTAFGKVVEIYKKTGTLDGDTIHHKMVSDCFDIGQIFFEFDKHKDKFEIIVWDKENDLEALKNSDNAAHRQLAETYRIFLEQDGSTYNFDLMDQMYLLNFTKAEFDTAEINIIGATSPATLFFTSANNLDFVTRNVQFSNSDRPFDNHFCPLYKRDIEFLKFLWALKANIPNFSRLFKELEAYITESFKLMDEKTKRILREINRDDLDKYSDIPVGDRASHPVYVLRDVKLKQHISEPGNIEKDSGFVIDSEYLIEGHKPLVLPVDTYVQSTIYTKKDRWNRNTKVPFFVCDDENQVILPKDRTLPDEGSHYPYLTISDFLTDTIVRMPYEINKDSFFDGNLIKANGKSYLLPLTNLFFQFFTADQLKESMRDGRKMFELKNNAGGITVVLRIPIKEQKYIEYQRTYFECFKPDVTKNDGRLVEHDFVFALFPNIRFNADKEAFYRFGIIPDEYGANNFTAKYAGRTKANTVDYTRNDSYNYVLQCKNFILENSNFDYLQIICPDGNLGIVIPNFKDCSGQKAGKERFKFAVDFGTTNTHIEYSRGNQRPVPFDIEDIDKQIHLMTSSNLGSIKPLIFESDFIPDVIGNGKEYKLPMRTALNVARNCKFSSGVSPFVQGNIGFIYEKRKNYSYNQFVTGLKWASGDGLQDEEDNKNKVKCYIESLCFLLRNKVLSSNGDLLNTTIVWSYPASMEGKRLELFEKIWQDAYQRFFSDNLQNLISVTESIAPYIFYKDDHSAVADMVSIDIGGGTTDMVIVVKEQVKFITSFRFAANSIFGNGYAKNSMNGIIRHFSSEIEKGLEDSGLRTLKEIYSDILGEGDSANIASFFFSLKNSRDIIVADQKYNTNVADQLDFQAKLNADSTYKIVFVVFYGAIIYHMANLLKSQKMGMPRHITFSGNGSRIVQILSRKNEILEDFSKLIIEYVFDEKYNGKKLTILQKDNPKEVTCKGAILYDCKDENYKSVSKVILQGIDGKSVFEKEKYIDIKQSEYVAQSVDEVRRFLRLLLDLLNGHSEFMKNFGISFDSLDILETEGFSDDLITYANKGLNQKLHEVNMKQPIEETFFFYPLNGLINVLSDEIHNKISNLI